MRKVPVLAVLAATTVTGAGAAFALGDDGGDDAVRIRPAAVEVSGPCDEAEHATDPRCTGVTVTTPTTLGAPTPDSAPTTAPRLDDDGSHPGDISGPCDEAEHAADPRCTGAGSSDDDNSGPGSDDSGHDDDSDDDSSGHDGSDDDGSDDDSSGHDGSDDD